jgi:tryptophan synthase alpha chain
MKSTLSAVFERARSENRAALIGYLPASFPTKARSVSALNAMIEGGVDIVEVGLPYSDPIMDGPVIQKATEEAIANGFHIEDVFEVVAAVNAPALVMSYWNPIEKYGIDRFAEELNKSGGQGVITPDLTIEESAGWQNAMAKESLARIYVVAPSTKDERLSKVVSECSGFVYAASLMGVTGARTVMSASAAELVARIRAISSTPVCVGLGVSTGAQAREIAQYADGVIVGSAFIKLILDSSSEAEANRKVRELAFELSTSLNRD